MTEWVNAGVIVTLVQRNWSRYFFAPTLAAP